jgi:hypothetical protein
MYRLYDEAGTLLYIGISWSALQRIAQHHDDKHWWRDVATVKIETIKGSRPAAAQAERQAIIAETPLYNIVYNTAGSKPTKPKPANRWMCQYCHEPAAYVQYHLKRYEWSCVCKRHDPYPPGQDFMAYWWDTARLQTNDDIARSVQHMNQTKDWFSHNEWRELLSLCLDKPHNARRKPFPR